MSAFIRPVAPSAQSPLSARAQTLCSRRAVAPSSRTPRKRAPHATLTSPPPPPPPSPPPFAPGEVLTLSSAEHFDALLEHAAQRDALLVLHFSAAWCRKCAYVAAMLNKLAPQYAHVYFAKLDVNRTRRVPAQFAIRTVPTFVMLRQRRELQRYGAADKPDVVRQRLHAMLRALATRRDHHARP